MEEYDGGRRRERGPHREVGSRPRCKHRVPHVIPQEYAIDYQKGLKPGIVRVRMQAKVHLITRHNDMAKTLLKQWNVVV